MDSLRPGLIDLLKPLGAFKVPPPGDGAPLPMTIKKEKKETTNDDNGYIKTGILHKNKVRKTVNA